MGFFGPDYNSIVGNYNNDVQNATNQYVNNMSQYADSGAGANVQNQQNTSATQPNVAWDVLGSVNDYLDPSIQQGANQVSANYGGEGSLFSGAAAKGFMDYGQNQYAAAYDRATQDNNRINQLGQQQFNNQMSIDQFNNNANQQNFSNQYGVNQSNFGNYNDIYGTQLGQQVNAANTTAQMKASESSMFDNLMQAGQLGVGAMSAMYGGGLATGAAGLLQGIK